MPAAAAIYSCCLLSAGSYFDTHCNVQTVVNGCICNRFLYFICKVFIESSAICTQLVKHVIVSLEGKPKKT